MRSPSLKYLRLLLTFRFAFRWLLVRLIGQVCLDNARDERTSLEETHVEAVQSMAEGEVLEKK